MHEELNDRAPALPGQAGQRRDAVARQIGQAAQTAAGPMLGEPGLGVVAGPSSSEHPLAPVAIAERRPKLEVVAPELELGARGVARRDEPGELLASVRLPRLEDGARQALVDEARYVIVDDAGPDARPLQASSRPAPVAHEAFGIDGPLEHVPAPRASRDAGQEPVAMPTRVVAHPAPAVRLLPGLPIDDRRPRLLDTEAPGPPEDAERRLRLDDPLDRRRRPGAPAERRRDPVVCQPVRDAAPAGAAGALGEDAPHDLGRRLVDERLAGVVASIAERRPAWEPPAGDGAALGGAERLIRLVALPLRHEEQEAEHRASHRRRRIDRLRDAHDPRAAVVELLDRRQAADERPGESVEPRDDDAAALPLLDPAKRLAHPWTVHRPARAVQVLEDLPEAHPVKTGPAFDRFPLLGRRLEAIAAPPADDRNANVPIEREESSVHPRIVFLDATSRGSVAPPQSRPSGSQRPGEDPR